MPTNSKKNIQNDSESTILAGKERFPKISVIVPVYKVEKYLPECIESVLAQTFTDFELILVDDGSPDNSGKICDDYAKRDSRIRVFHKENGGVSSARNLGLDNARGEWIAFVDSDDWVGEKYLEHLYLGEKGDSTLIVGGIVRFQGTNCECGSISFDAGNMSVPDGFCRGKLYIRGYPFSKLYKTRIVWEKNLRFDEEVSLCEDELFMLHYLEYSSGIIFRNSCDYCYRVVGGSLSNSHRDFEEQWSFFFKQKKVARKINISKKEKFAWWCMFRAPALNALFSLYRPNTLRARKERLRKIRLVAGVLRESFVDVPPRNFWEKFLHVGAYGVFDFFARSLFLMRHGVLRKAWELYRSSKKPFGCE